MISNLKFPYLRCNNSCEILHYKFHIGWEYPLQHLFRHVNEWFKYSNNFDVITETGIMTISDFREQIDNANRKHKTT